MAATMTPVQDLPAGIQLNYTLVMEDEARAVDNDRIDVLVQVIF